MELIAHHRVDPHPLAADDLFHHALEHFPMQPLIAEDLTNLLRFDVGELLDFSLLFRQHRPVVIPLRQGRRVDNATHGDRLRKGGGQRRRQDDPQLRGRRGDPEHQPKDVDQAVMPTEDDVAKRPANSAFVGIGFVQRLLLTDRLRLSHRSLSSQLSGYRVRDAFAWQRAHRPCTTRSALLTTKSCSSVMWCSTGTMWSPSMCSVEPHWSQTRW